MLGQTAVNRWLTSTSSSVSATKLAFLCQYTTVNVVTLSQTLPSACAVNRRLSIHVAPPHTGPHPSIRSRQMAAGLRVSITIMRSLVKNTCLPLYQLHTSCPVPGVAYMRREYSCFNCNWDQIAKNLIHDFTAVTFSVKFAFFHEKHPFLWNSVTFAIFREF